MQILRRKQHRELDLWKSSPTIINHPNDLDLIRSNWRGCLQPIPEFPLHKVNCVQPFTFFGFRRRKEFLQTAIVPLQFREVTGGDFLKRLFIPAQGLKRILVISQLA